MLDLTRHRWSSWSRCLLLCGGLLAAVSSGLNSRVQAQSESGGYAQKVLQSDPVLYFRFEEAAGEAVQNHGTATGLKVTNIGSVGQAKPGPRGREYPDFSPENRALQLTGSKQRLVIADEAEKSPLQFRNGDAFTIEAWVKPDAKMNATFPYIIGKGRTYNRGFNSNNQNYALRLASSQGTAQLSFYFVDEEVVNKGSSETNGHRWTSTAGVPQDGDWHHVALVYEFGKPESIRGYIDGKPTSGKWDLAGPTTKPPIVDTDEVWIGSSMNGSNAYQGLLDEVAVHRQILAPEVLAERYKHQAVDHLKMLVEQAVAQPVEGVQVNVHEGISSSRDWKFRPTDAETVYQTSAFALTELPKKYTARGIIADRVSPLMVHTQAKVTLPAGPQEIVLRSLSAARLYVDGQLLVENPFMQLNSSAHGTMHPLKPPQNGELSLPAAHLEKRVVFESDGKPHHFSLLTIAGHKSTPADLGELVVAVGKPGQEYHLLGPELNHSFTDEGWLAFQAEEEEHRLQWNARRRAEISQPERDYWQQRHAAAREWVNSLPAIDIPGDENEHPIDRFVQAALRQTEFQPTSVIDDLSFLRRVTLDLTGTNPTPAQIEAYLAESAETRRQAVIDRLLQSRGWADHWIAYWQDVLAENPGLTKPMLNNTGPFRWYLQEAFADNRPIDRIVSELILMEGSPYHGGTAGFGIASENDVPMAAKAHILGTAFLGVDMKCARCHDSPYHETLQKDLFEVAAMLGRKPQKVPMTSSIPGTPEQLAAMAVQVTLKPGESIDPRWPFASLLDPENGTVQQMVRDRNNTRESLACIVTHHENERFAQVIANRVWRKLIGRGIVEPAEDWETGEPSHPELLNWLARELVRHDYDLKALTRTIVTSDLYQRQALSGQYEAEKLFAGPTRRRMTAEQLIDSIYLAVGKELPSEVLTYNSDGRQNKNYFVNFGVPRRAWELVAISNERERPSMNLPKAQSVADFLATYGWRSERQDPVTDREMTATPLQPLEMANGNALNRAVDISEHSQMLEVCLAAESPEEVVDQMFGRVLSRLPTSEERQTFVALLRPGFEQRKTEYQEVPKRKVFRSPLTWTAHFDPVASEEGVRQELEAERGDVPTQRLTVEWRQRAEDVLWVLFNTPEFVFVP